MPKAFVNGITIHYQRRARTGPEVVLVHGLATNLAFWYFGVVPLLARDFQLTLYDLRGHGRSDMPPSGYTTADLVADLHGLLNHLELDQVHLVGHSFGGAVALHYAVLYPERVKSLTLADARIRAFQPTQQLKDWPNAEIWQRELKALKVPLPASESEMGYRFLEALAEAKLEGREVRSKPGFFRPFGLSKNSMRTADRWLKLLRNTSARADFQQIAGLTQDQICRVHQPVLAIFGELSNCLPSCWSLRRHLPDCRVIIVPKGGHFHPVVRARFFALRLRKFLLEQVEPAKVASSAL
jgi:pimeloyl-ACP methyl ester carboxylesterase